MPLTLSYRFYSFLVRVNMEPKCNFLVDPDVSLKCCICLEVARDPKQEEGCGKLFCTCCIKEWNEESCPTCRTDNAKYFSDKRSEEIQFWLVAVCMHIPINIVVAVFLLFSFAGKREIQALKVQCSNVENGCSWEGTLETLEKHIENCEFEYVVCPNSCCAEESEEENDDAHFLRKDLNEHLLKKCPERQYKCLDCGTEDAYSVITGPHEDTCEKKIIVCPTENCGLILERGQVSLHLDETCRFKEVCCKYEDVGCEVKLMRKDIVPHEEDIKFHFPIAMGKISELNEIVSIKSQLEKSAFSCPECRVTFKLVNYSSKVSRRFQFKPFYTSSCGYKMCLFSNGSSEGYLSFYLKILKGPYDSRLEWPLEATFVVELLNQRNDDNHHCNSVTFDGKSGHCQAGGGGYGYQQYIKLSDLKEVGDTQYLKDDAVYFRVTSCVRSYKPWLVHTHVNE